MSSIFSVSPPAEMVETLDIAIAQIEAPNEANAIPTLAPGEESPEVRLEKLKEMREMALDMIRRSEAVSPVAGRLRILPRSDIAISDEERSNRGTVFVEAEDLFQDQG